MPAVAEDEHDRGDAEEHPRQARASGRAGSTRAPARMARPRVGASRKRSSTTSANVSTTRPAQKVMKPYEKFMLKTSGKANSASQWLRPIWRASIAVDAGKQERVGREIHLVGDLDRHEIREQVHGQEVAPIRQRNQIQIVIFRISPDRVPISMPDGDGVEVIGHVEQRQEARRPQRNQRADPQDGEGSDEERLVRDALRAPGRRRATTRS